MLLGLEPETSQWLHSGLSMRHRLSIEHLMDSQLPAAQQAGLVLLVRQPGCVGLFVQLLVPVGPLVPPGPVGLPIVTVGLFVLAELLVSVEQLVPVGLPATLGHAALPGLIGPVALPVMLEPAALPVMLEPAALPATLDPAALPATLEPVELPGSSG